MVCTVEGWQRDRRAWLQLPTPSPQKVVLSSSFAARKACADSRVCPLPGGDKDPDDVLALSPDESPGKFNASSRNGSAGQLDTPSQDKSPGNSTEKSRPS